MTTDRIRLPQRGNVGHRRIQDVGVDTRATLPDVGHDVTGTEKNSGMDVKMAAPRRLVLCGTSRAREQGVRDPWLMSSCGPVTNAICHHIAIASREAL